MGSGQATPTINSLHFQLVAQHVGSPLPLECSPSWSWCLSTQLLLPCQGLQDFLSTLCLLWCWAYLSPDHWCQGSRADDDIIIVIVIVVTVIIPDSAMLVTARLT